MKMRGFLQYILIAVSLSCCFGTVATAQQFQPLFLIEWADSNGMIPVTSNFMGFNGVQVYARLDSILAAAISELQIGTCQDTITQAAHGFAVGDLIGQESGNGDYFLANVGVPDSLPVAAVYKVLTDSTFVPCNEGFFEFTHGESVGVDYFLQPDGSVSDTPDSTYQVFAFRTFGANTAYFDVPELVVESADTSGTTGQTVEDADWYDSTTDAPPVVMGQSIYTTGDVSAGSTLTIGIPQGFRSEQLFVEQAFTEVSRFGSGDSWDLRIYRDGSGMWVGNRNGPTGDHQTILFPSSGNYISFYANGTQSFRITEDGYFVYYQCPNYADNAAADADGDLPTGGVYTVTSEDRTLRIKP